MKNMHISKNTANKKCNKNLINYIRLLEEKNGQVCYNEKNTRTPDGINGRK